MFLILQQKMRTIITLISVLFFVSCQNSEKPTYEKASKNQVKKLQSHPGKKLMETNCYVCHNPAGSHDNRIAPPMIAVKKHYKSSKVTKEEFKKGIQDWIINPSKENSKMPGAIKKFGIMPKTPFPKKTIDLIADYLFDNEIEKPEWFDAHEKEEHGQGKEKEMNDNQAGLIENLPYDERGLKYALSTKSELGKNLMGKIQKEGTLAALKFCNIKAHPLTDSMSIVHKATIKRVSDKPRNPKNVSNNIENGYINIFKEDARLLKESKLIVVESLDNVEVYYPIKTNNMCLQCHGKPGEEIKSSTLTQIHKLYPQDLAFGYSENQVRGIWSVTFNK